MCPLNLPLHFHFAFLLYSDSLEAYFVFRFIKSEIVGKVEWEWERKYGFVAAACYLKSSSGSERTALNKFALAFVVVMCRVKQPCCNVEEERKCDEGLVEFGIIIINGSHFHAFFVCAEIVMVISMKWSCGVGGGWEMYLM